MKTTRFGKILAAFVLTGALWATTASATPVNFSISGTATVSDYTALDGTVTTLDGSAFTLALSGDTTNIAATTKTDLFTLETVNGNIINQLIGSFSVSSFTVDLTNTTDWTLSSFFYPALDAANPAYVSLNFGFNDATGANDLFSLYLDRATAFDFTSALGTLNPFSTLAGFVIGDERGDLAVDELAIGVAPGPGSPDPVPEPSTIFLVGAGIFGFAVYRRRSAKI